MNQTPEAERALPCLFCGGTNVSTTAYAVQPDNFHSAYVECGDCEARGPNALTVDGWLPSKEEAITEAVSAWNRRAIPQAAAEPVAHETIIAHAFLKWNRSLEKPVVEISKELYVARKVLELAGATPDRAPSTDSATERDAARWKDLLAAVVREIPNKNPSKNGDAPGHSHRRPGIWDDFNGAKSGQQCAWCLIWKEANQAIAAMKGEGQ